MDHYATSYALLLLISAASSATAAAIVWKRRTVTGAPLVLMYMLALVEWSLTYAFYWMSVGPAARLFWLNATYFGVCIVPTAFFLFIVVYTHRGHWITRSTRLLLAVEPVAAILLLWTDPWHNLFFGGLRTPESSTILAGGPGFWLHVLYSYSLILAACILLAQFYLHLQRPYRQQAGYLLFGALLPWISNIISIAGLNPLPRLDLTPIVFTLTGLIYTYNLFRNRFLDLVPIARSQIFDTLQECVLVVDPQQRLVDLNPAAEQFLRSLGEETLRFVPGQPITDVLRMWPEWLAESEGQRHDVEITDQQGIVHVYDRRISTIHNRHGRPQGKVLLLTDITRQKQAELQEQQLAFEQERRRIMALFLADAAHEFKTPLTVIQTSLYLLRRSLQADDQLKRISLIEQQSQLMNRLVEDLMTILRLQDPSQQILTELDLHQILNTAAEAVQTQAAAKNVRLVRDFSRVPIRIKGDGDQLEHAFTNLIDNAVRYSHPGGVVTLQTFRLAEAVTVRVVDQGVGIDPENLPHIFDSFYRSDTAHTTPGLGLGLSIARRVIDNHHGTIHVQSQPNEGATFEVALFDSAASERTLAPLEVRDLPDHPVDQQPRL